MYFNEIYLVQILKNNRENVPYNTPERRIVKVSII